MPADLKIISQTFFLGAFPNFLKWFHSAEQDGSQNWKKKKKKKKKKIFKVHFLG